MNYKNLKDAIVAVIKQNGNEEITGNILQQVLVAMVNSLGSGYQFRGIATPETNPGTPDQRVFYLASATGTYSDFGFIVSDEICALVYDTAWHKQTIIALDQEPTEDSGNLISSGAIYTALQNLADVYMKLVESAEENHLASFDGDGQVKDAGIGLDNLALPAGHYPDLFAGFAGNLVDTRSAGTRQQFAFRQSGGDGVNYMRKILGRTEAFNQLVQNGNFADTSIWTTQNSAALTVNSNVGTLTLNAQYGTIKQSAPLVAGHAYFFAVTYKTATSRFILGIGQYNSVNNRKALTATADGAWHTESIVWSGTDTAIITGDKDIFVGNRDESAGSIELKNIILIDLTLEGLGITTADQFRALHPLPYYNYNAGVLKNNAATGLETTGFNQWDEEAELGTISTTTGENVPDSSKIRSKNYIPVIGGDTYFAACISSYTGVIQFIEYDVNKNFVKEVGKIIGNEYTPSSSAAYIRFFLQSSYGTTYNNDICINLSDASRNGIYEPYWKREIVLGLDNLACHDENNNAVVVNGLDGVGTSQDELIVEDGWGTKINKRRARVNLGDLSWEYISGANARFKATPSPATVSPGNSNMPPIVCSKYAPDTYTNIYAGTGDKQVGIGGDANIYVRDTAYTDAATFKTAMAGVYLDYPLATPKVLTLDNPIPALIEVDNLGTEKRLPEDTADNPQAPFECDSNYSISTANLVRKLSEL